MLLRYNIEQKKWSYFDRRPVTQLGELFANSKNLDVPIWLYLEVPDADIASILNRTGSGQYSSPKDRKAARELALELYYPDLRYQLLGDLQLYGFRANIIPIHEG